MLQAQATARVLAKCIETSAIMARNSFMERNLVENGDPRAGEWEDSAQGRAFNRAHHEAKVIERNLDALRKAASYNPKKPPKE